MAMGITYTRKAGVAAVHDTKLRFRRILNLNDTNWVNRNHKKPHEENYFIWFLEVQQTTWEKKLKITRFDFHYVNLTKEAS